MGCYINSARFYFDYIFNNASKEYTSNKIKEYVYQLQDFILWHYSYGSKYDTLFWKHSKYLWNSHDKLEIEKIIRISRDMSEQDIQKSIHSNFKYAQWQLWNFNNFIKGME